MLAILISMFVSTFGSVIISDRRKFNKVTSSTSKLRNLFETLRFIQWYNSSSLPHENQPKLQTKFLITTFLVQTEALSRPWLGDRAQDDLR